MKYKLLATDFDDTLAHNDLSVSERTKKAIDAYRAAGGVFLLATGRMYDGIIPIAEALGLDGEMVCFQGAMVTDIKSGEVLLDERIELDTALNILEFLESQNKIIHVYENGFFVVSKQNPYSDMYAKITGTKYIVPKTDLCDYVREKGTGVIKILVVDEPENIAPFMRVLEERYPDVFIATSKKWIIEIISKRANKGVGVDFVAKRYGIAPEEVICVGDSHNDVKMIEYAGLGACVENGSEIAKKAADIIVPSNENDGVAYLLEHAIDSTLQ